MTIKTVLILVFAVCLWCVCSLPVVSGENDTISSSATNPATFDAAFRCQNGGTPEESGVCRCAPGFEGIWCSRRDCGDHGYSFTSAPCTCFPGWMGPRCECKHGTLNSLNRCVCDRGWKGKSCDTIICEHGNSGTTDSCTCHSGWTGKRCDTKLIAGISSTVYSWIFFLAIIVGITACIVFCWKKCLRNNTAAGGATVAYQAGQLYAPPPGGLATTAPSAPPLAIATNTSSGFAPAYVPPMRQESEPLPYEDAIKAV